MSKSNLEKEKNFVSVVAYMRNCESNIEEFIKTVDREISENFQVYEFILVDDYSDDETMKTANSCVEHLSCSVSIIKMAYKQGREKSMSAGIDLAIGDFVYEFDTTLINYDSSLIIDIYKKSLEGYDAVMAAPKGQSAQSSKMFYKLLKKTSHQNIKLTSETFRVVSRRMINRLMKNRQQTFYRKAVYHYSGLDTAVVEYVPINNIKADDSMNLSERFSMAMDVLVNHTNIGIRVAGIISIIFLVFAILTTVYTVFMYFTLDNIQPGWTTTMFFLSISFTGVFFILFIVTKYLTNILTEVKDLPMYVYKSVSKK